jgi:hypothetical protein
MAGGLSPAVTRELERLGARKRAEPSSRSILHHSGVLPEPIRELIQDWEWPEELRFELPDEALDRLSVGPMYSLDFAYDPLEACDHCDGCEGKQMVMIGLGGGGNYILAVKLDDPEPSDPTLYIFAHDEPFVDDPSFNAVRFSSYLAALRVEQDEDEDDL